MVSEKASALRLLGRNYGRPEIKQAIEDAGFQCRIYGYRSEAKADANIVIKTQLPRADGLIKFARWAYENWPIKGTFGITLTSVDGWTFSGILDCDFDDKTVSFRVNGENGYECRHLEGIGSFDSERLHPHGHLTQWKTVLHTTGRRKPVTYAKVVLC